MSNDCKSQTLTVEITRRIEIAPASWETATGKYITFGTFPVGNLIGHISIYPNGNEDSDCKLFCSIFVVLKHNPSETITKEDEYRKVTVTVKCGSIIKSFNNNTSAFEAKGWGYPNFAKIVHVKANPLIYVTIKMNNDPKFVAPNVTELSLDKQQELLYKFNKTDGDITLVVVTHENNDDLKIQSPAQKKSRRLNNNNNIKEEDEDDNEIKVSGIILKSASDVFKNVLTNNMLEKNEKKIRIYAKSVKCVDDMVYFMCSNKLRGDSNAMDVIQLAHYYQMGRLKYKCINKMISDISVDNFVDIVNIFDLYEIKDGYITLIEFANANADELKKCDNFDQLSHAFKMAAIGLAKH